MYVRLRFILLLEMIVLFLGGCLYRGGSTTTLPEESNILPRPTNTLIPVVSTLEPTFPPPSTNVVVPTPTLQVPTLTPTAILPTFTFNGKIVFAVQNDSYSTLWFFTGNQTDPEILLQEVGVSFLQPLLSPKGNFLAYIRYANETQAIWVMNMTTRETQQWSDLFPIRYRTLQGIPQPVNGLELQAWSPNETQVIYQELELETPLSQPIWSYTLSGNRVKKTLGSRIVALTWDPHDLQKVVYLSRDRGIYRVDLSETSAPELLVEIPGLLSGSVSWHPNERIVAVAGSSFDSTQLLLLNVDTLEVQEIESNISGWQWVQWSPNGKMLFFAEDDTIQLLKFEEDNFDFWESFTIISGIRGYVDKRQQLWLQNGTYFGLVKGGETIEEKDTLCFYSIVGGEVTCLLKAEDILDDLGEDDPLAQVAITWSHN